MSLKGESLKVRKKGNEKNIVIWLDENKRDGLCRLELRGCSFRVKSLLKRSQWTRITKCINVLEDEGGRLEDF